jgi:hypothetical protein
LIIELRNSLKVKESNNQDLSKKRLSVQKEMQTKIEELDLEIRNLNSTLMLKETETSILIETFENRIKDISVNVKL